MKKGIVIALCFTLILSLAACVKHTAEPSQPAIGGDPATWGPAVDGEPKVPAESSGENVQIPDPFVEYDTLADAAAATGFEISVPDSIDGYSSRIIRVLAADDFKMIEVIYHDAQDSAICIRKAPGAEDISGDYNQYDRSEAAVMGEYNVTLRGNDDAIILATWTAGDYSFSMQFGTGVSADTVSQLIAYVG